MEFIRRRDLLKFAGGALLGMAAGGGDALLAVRRATRSGPADSGYDPNALGEPTDLDEYDFILPRVQVVELPFKGRGKGPDVWNVRPGGDANLLRELSRVVRCHVKPIQGAVDWQPQYAYDGQLNAAVTFDDPDLLRHYPFLFMTGENHFQLTSDQKGNLKDFLSAGGFILMDDCVVGSGGDFFYASCFQLLENLFGRGSVKAIPREHEVFHNVFDLGDIGLPYLQYSGGRGTHGQNHGARGLFLGDRLAVFLSSNDLHCGWCDSHGVEWGPEGYRKTIQMGINIILYSLTH
ncbi:MAG: DUF4159 domain-containing protein [Planctomycetes bacterium]|nr:DUF4159 domain-containing protein [Planctomycetota bacterium]